MGTQPRTGRRAMVRPAVLLPAAALAAMLLAPGTATATPSFPAPVISSISPTTGPVGTVVTITGSGLTGASLVEFAHATATTWTVVSDTRVDVTVPEGAIVGGIGVQTPGGYAGSAQTFEIIRVVTTIPASAAVGSVVRILGLTLGSATGVTFNGVAASFTVVDGTRIDATVPAGATTGKIAVATPYGTATSTFDFPILPKVTTFAPGSGPVGSTVTITGATFTGATSVKMGAVAMPFTVLSPGEIRATVPAGAASGRISVTTPAGTTTSTAAFTVSLAPVVTSFSPGSGRIGATVTVSGANLGYARTVTVNGRMAPYRILSPTSLTLIVPTGATSGRISVTSAYGTATSATAFTVIP